MSTTQILYPLDNDISGSNIKILKDSWKDIMKTLNDLKEGEAITFDEHLSNLGVSEESYIL